MLLAGSHAQLYGSSMVRPAGTQCSGLLKLRVIQRRFKGGTHAESSENMLARVAFNDFGGGIVPKSTVEDCLSFKIADVTERKTGVCTGTIRWTRYSQTSSIGFTTNWETAPSTVTLSYADDAIGKNSIRLEVELQSTKVRNGGKRWWFTCPLIRDGVPCGRRCGCLHLPPGQNYFGCRQCHGLTYESSQQAHQLDHLLQRLASNEGRPFESLTFLR